MADSGLVKAALPELRIIDMLAALAARYEHLPFNMSHWNADQTFTDALLANMPPCVVGSPFQYNYSATLIDRGQIPDNLALSRADREVFIVENGTSTIHLVTNYLELRRARSVIVLPPTYFSTLYALARAGIQPARHYMRRDRNGFLLPDLASLARYVAIWITNPVYNAGKLMTSDDTQMLLELMDRGATVVGDLSLATRPLSLGGAVENHPNFLGIYCPHKALSINSMKFAASSCPQSKVKEFEDWGDIMTGSLSLSCLMAIRHFLSDGFDKCVLIVQILLTHRSLI
jgi:hypothetical protein